MFRQHAISISRKLIVHLRKTSCFAFPIIFGDVLMSTNCKLDRIDLRILSRLQAHGRITNVELADAVGLSPSPCLIRVKRLESAGYIAGYAAQILLEKMGDVQSVFTQVTLADHRREDSARFVAAIRGVDEIVECHLASGGYDYLLK